MFLIQFALCNACKLRGNLVLNQQSLSLIYKVLFQALFQLNYMISFNTVLHCVAYEYSCLLSLLATKNVLQERHLCLSTKILYRWHKICPKSDQDLWLVEEKLLLHCFSYCLQDNERQMTKVKCNRDEFTAKQSIISWNIFFFRRSIWVLLWTNWHSGIPWLPDLLCKYCLVMPSAWNFCR